MSLSDNQNSLPVGALWPTKQGNILLGNRKVITTYPP